MILTVEQTLDRLLRRTCPLFAKGGPRDSLKSPPQVGSAVLFRFGQCSLLLTANHVRWDEEGCERELLIRSPGKAEDSTTFNSLKRPETPWRVKLPDYRDADIVCIPMSENLADSVGEMCEFVEPDDIGHPDDEIHGCGSRFLLIGFPNSSNKQAVIDPSTGRARKGWGNTAFFAEPQHRLPDDFVARDGQSSASHFALEGNTKMRPFVGGSICHAPKLNGMSGGGVWKLQIDPRTQLVERCALVGIFIKQDSWRGKIVLTSVCVEWAIDPKNWWHGDITDFAHGQ